MRRSVAQLNFSLGMHWQSTSMVVHVIILKYKEELGKMPPSPCLYLIVGEVLTHIIEK